VPLCTENRKPRQQQQQQQQQPASVIEKLMQTNIILIISRTHSQISSHHAICAQLCAFQLWFELGQQTAIGIHNLSSLFAAIPNSGMKRHAPAISQRVFPYDRSRSSCACTKHATRDIQCAVPQFENIVCDTAQRSQPDSSEAQKQTKSFSAAIYPTCSGR